MMQMLHAGGIPVLTDAHRPADISNPRGYFEYEKVKWLAADNSWLPEARGKAVKVIAQLVPFLPSGLDYRFLFLERDLREVIHSQETMMSALGRTVASPPTDLTPVFERNLEAARIFVRQLPGAMAETVQFREILKDPERVIDRLADFLSRPELDRKAMRLVMDGTLYRSRAADGDGHSKI